MAVDILEEFRTIVRDVVREELAALRTGTPTPADSGPMLTVAQAAASLQVDVKTVRTLAYNGAIPFTKVGKQLRFERAAIEAYRAHGSRAA